MNKQRIKILLFGLFAVIVIALVNRKEKVDQPNILWLTCEDISPYFSFYGDSTAQTPVLDKLASSSLVYDNAFATVGVCAPSRSSIITGMYPISIGTHNMRTGRDYAGWGTRVYNGDSEAKDINGTPISHYSAVIPSHVKCFTEYLRAAGYYCTNNAKTDYQFAPPVTAWDASGNDAHWKNRKDGQPFFAVFNHEVTHESRMWMNKNLEMTVNPDSVPLPAYFPENPIVRQDVARNYSNIELLDAQIGERLTELEEAGLLENTIVFFYSDHGGPLPRGKREHYDSGLKVPFIVSFPKSIRGDRVNELISFVDLAPTILSLAGIEPPAYMQGQAFLGKFKSETKRKYIYGSGDRFDEYPDRIRSIRDSQFMYVRNYHPELPAYKDVAYRKNMDMMNELIKLNNNNELNPEQAYYFRTTKFEEELYNCKADPFQLNNLIEDNTFEPKISELSYAMDNWLIEVRDMGAMPEAEILNNMWPKGIQPQTEKPSISINDEIIQIECTTEGASIAYISSKTELEPNLDSGWQLYHKPIENKNASFLYVLANRIGYKDSEIVKIDLLKIK
ncbi:MAG: sulfatase [Prolixibacteraceae bacterium]|jgi:N-sulfoglucosamine sulfohydrolase|nr:sulfatase [Prolixibacteraceae bacterium]